MIVTPLQRWRVADQRQDWLSCTLDSAQAVRLNGSRYLAEHQYRFNRRFDIKAIMPRLLRAATTGLRSEAWLRSAEYSC